MKVLFVFLWIACVPVFLTGGGLWSTYSEHRPCHSPNGPLCIYKHQEQQQQQRIIVSTHLSQDTPDEVK